MLLFFFVTDANFPMARKSAYRGGLVPSVRRTAFLTTTLTAGITTVRMTEVRCAFMDGTARTARCFVFLKMTTNEGITRATTRATKCASTDIVLLTVQTACWVDTVQIAR